MQMRKKQAGTCLLTMLLALGSLTAHAAESQIYDYSQQVPVFVNQMSTWKPKAKASYAYVDLDQDGTLEILTSYTSKKGEVTNELFELREGTVTECTLPWEKKDEQPELKQSPVPVYYDAQEETYYYVFGTQDDAFGTALWLKDGTLQEELLEEDPATRFEGLEELEASFGWVSTAEHSLNDAPLEQLSELAGQSLSAFKVKAAVK